MSGITTHIQGAIKENVELDPTIVLSSRNKFIFSAGNCVSESYSIAEATLDIQTGSLRFTVEVADEILPFEIPLALHEASIQIDYFTAYIVQENAAYPSSYLNSHLGYIAMNPEEPPGAEDFTSIAGSGTGRVKVPTRVGPINHTMLPKTNYSVIISKAGDTFEDPDCDITFFGFAIEFSLISGS